MLHAFDDPGKIVGSLYGGKDGFFPPLHETPLLLQFVIVAQ